MRSFFFNLKKVLCTNQKHTEIYQTNEQNSVLTHDLGQRKLETFHFVTRVKQRLSLANMVSTLDCSH